MAEPLLVVLDTMVIVRAIIGREGSVNDRILRAVATGDLRLAVSDAGHTELVKVMGYESVKHKVKNPARAVAVALDVGTVGCFYHPKRFDWPTVPDPKDGWLLDLAYTSGAAHVVTDDPHLLTRRPALKELGFSILAPQQVIPLLPPLPPS